MIKLDNASVNNVKIIWMIINRLY